MDYGTLRVATPDGQIREYPITAPSVMIGRADGNQVVIDHVSVSRRHAQLVIESGRMTIEDMGSGTGTFVGSQRIDANKPNLVESGQTMRFGDCEARFIAADAAAPSPLSAPGSNEVEQTIGVALTSPSQPVSAGSPTTATVNVQNRGNVVDELTIAIVDLPAGWAKVSRPTLSLVPGARDEITVVIQPPKDSTAAAGEYPFSVAVTSKVHGREVRALGKVTVRAFEGFRVTMEPARAARDFAVTVSNNGNVAANVTLAAVADANDMEFAFEESSFELAPGADKRVALVAKPKAKKNFGPTVNRPFRVEARQSGVQQPATTGGQLIVKPPLEPYKIPVLAVLALLVLGGIGFAALQLFGGSGSKKASPSPTATVAAAVSATAPAATATPAGLHVGGNGVIVNSDPVPTNTNCLAVRTTATRNGDNISGRLCSGEKVAIKGGPTTADGFTWWQIQSASGLSGWAAEKSADGATPFIQAAP
ncbi:MAG: FHA domain-containing protein [Dehalococcoidia bacterium]|nr:FHA domain-containing protein [Dehalococcoidia bacterium]